MAHVDANVLAACQIDPARILRLMGRTAYPWQRRVLATSKSFLLNVHRLGGKTTVCGVKAASVAVFKPGSLTVIISRTQEQAKELLRKTITAYHCMGDPVPVARLQTQFMELTSGSRVLSLPAKEASVRGFSTEMTDEAVTLLLIDEAARVPEDVISAVEPMMSRGGQLGMLTTPRGPRGTFYREFMDNPHGCPWTPGQPAMWEAGRYLKIAVPWSECPDISEQFVEHLRRTRGDDFVAQEYENSFTRVTGLVYAGIFDESLGVLVDDEPRVPGIRGGGLDFGWRDPFGAVWGFHDPTTDIIWVTGERKRSFGLLSEHAEALRGLRVSPWIADAGGAQQIAELRAANIDVRKAPFNKDLEAGIAAVNARIRTGRLRIVRPRCPKLLEEAQLYCYDEDNDDSGSGDTKGEKPIDDFNHCLDALRYWIMHTDRSFVANYRKVGGPGSDGGELAAESARPQRQTRQEWEMAAVDDPALWIGDDD